MGKISGVCTVKYIFFTFNVLLWILGCGGLVVGVWMEVNKEPYGVVLPSHAYLKATSLLISASVITLIIGFVGCCGSLIENRGMLIVYFVFLFVTFILGVVATALAFTNKEVLKKSLKTELLYSMEYSTYPNISDSSRDGVNNMLNLMQTQLHCCGVNNYTDWYRVGDRLKHVPESCCVHRMKDCGTSQSYEWYKRGCMKEIEYLLVRNFHIIGSIGLSIAVTQILNMVASIVLCCCLRDKKHRF